MNPHWPSAGSPARSISEAQHVAPRPRSATMRRTRRVLALAFCLVPASMLAPSAATADGQLMFTGRAGKHTWTTCVAEVGCRPYSLSTSVDGDDRFCKPCPIGRGPHARASFGVFYSTAALGPETLLVYSWSYRKKGGKWRLACTPKKICQFDSRKQAHWPGYPAGGGYVEMRVPIRKERNIRGSGST